VLSFAIYVRDKSKHCTVERIKTRMRQQQLNNCGKLDLICTNYDMSLMLLW